MNKKLIFFIKYIFVIFVSSIFGGFWGALVGGITFKMSSEGGDFIFGMKEGLIFGVMDGLLWAVFLGWALIRLGLKKSIPSILGAVLPPLLLAFGGDPVAAWIVGSFLSFVVSGFIIFAYFYDHKDNTKVCNQLPSCAIDQRR